METVAAGGLAQILRNWRLDDGIDGSYRTVSRKLASGAAKQSQIAMTILEDQAREWL